MKFYKTQDVVFRISTKDSENTRLLSVVKGLKVQALDEISSYKLKCDNDVLSEKLDLVESNILGTEFETVLTEDHIIKAMTMSQIINELSGEDDE